MTRRPAPAPVALALAVALVPGAAAAAPPAVAARPAFRLADPRITEASGIALGIRSPGIAYVQNDSGDTNRFFAIDARTGATVATVTVAGATNVDWEDVATARDPAGVPSVWLADTGDNDAARGEVRIYRVREPRIGRSERGAQRRTAPAEVWRLRYPGGPVDAEALAVAPDGAAYVVTKSVLGLSTVYRVPPDPDRRRVQVLQRVAGIDLAPHGVPNPFGAAGEVAVTGAAISPDGSTFAVRTYAEAYVWRLAGRDLAAALARPPTRVTLPRQPQGEGIALRDDRTALVDSEGAGTAVYRVALPHVAASRAPVTTGATRSPTGPATPAGPRSAAAGDPGPGGPTAWFAAAVAALLALGAAAWWWRRGRIGACRSPRNRPP